MTIDDLKPVGAGTGAPTITTAGTNEDELELLLPAASAANDKVLVQDGASIGGVQN